MALSSLLVISSFTPRSAVTRHLQEATGGTRPHASHMVFYLSTKEPESPSDWVEPKCWTLANVMEAMLQAGPHPEETEAAGLGKGRGQARRRARGDQVGPSQSEKMHKLGLGYQVCTPENRGFTAPPTMAPWRGDAGLWAKVTPAPCRRLSPQPLPPLVTN